MAILNKVDVSLAPWSKHKFDLSCDHCTTSDFMLLQPVYYRHMIPNQTIKLNANAFARMQPMAVPTYGRARLNLRAFVVPLDFIQPSFNELVTNSIYVPHNSGTPSIPTSSHTVSDYTLTSLFIGSSSSPSPFSITTPSGGVSDFNVSSQDYTFTSSGRQVYKILTSLGYRWRWTTKADVYFSMHNILAFVKIYLDWYALSSYYDTSTYNSLTALLKLESPTDFTVLQLSGILSLVTKVCYDGDYFTSAWDNPVGPNTNTFTQLSFLDPTSITSSSPHYSGIVTTQSNGTPVACVQYDPGSSSSYSPEYVRNLSEYQLQSLHALTDYMKRHQLTGARAVDRFLADYGVNLDTNRVKRSTYLGCKSIDIQIGDVTQVVNTNTSGPSNLGDYGGRGFLSGSSEFEFTSDSHCILMICASILPSGGYYQGFDRNLLHVNPTDFYHPDFDNLGVQSLAKGEVYTSPNSSFWPSGSSLLESFGYTPRYAEYKVPLDKVTGDFDIASAMAGGDSWHLMRKFDDASFTNSSANLHHSLGFCLGDDSITYDRIFNYSDKDNPLDNFYLVYHFDVVSYAPMKSLFDTYDFDHDEQHRHVTLETNGVKVN